MTVGTELRQARERAGLSIEEIGRRTKIQLYKIEALEQGDYDRLPQGIYLDGIVRSYCHEVMVAPEAMVERVRLERGKRPGDAEIPFSAPIDLHGPAKPREVQFIDVPEIDDELGSFVTEKRSHAAPAAPVAPSAPVAPRAPVAPSAPVAPIAPVAPVAPVAPNAPIAPIASVPPARITAPAKIAHRRIGALVPAIIVLAIAFLGGYLYQSWRLHERNGARLSTTESITPTEVTPKETPPDETAAPPSQPPQTSNDPPKAAANPAVQPDKVATTGSVPNLAGSWTLNTKVESSSVSRFAGLQLGYELRLEQKGDRITGVGRKVAENGTPINKRAQTPLSVSGTINGDRLTLNFVERGRRRPSRGKFVLLVDEGDSLRGRFSSTAARSSGIVEAHRLPTP